MTRSKITFGKGVNLLRIDRRIVIVLDGRNQQGRGTPSRAERKPFKLPSNPVGWESINKILSLAQTNPNTN